MMNLTCLGGYSWLLNFVRLNRPAEALAELTPAAPVLLEMNETRHATLGVLGACHALAGRLDEALSSFRAILEPTLLARMDPAAFDFYLVETLLTLGKAPEECILYLTLVSERAKAVGDLIVARRAHELLAQVNQ